MRSDVFLLAGAFAASATASLVPRAGVSSNLPSGWSYQGCYTDNVPNRVLTGASYADGSNMTEESCISFCSQRGFSFAGVEYAQECYCDYQLANASTLQPDTDCSMTCVGDSTEACGAGNRLTVFSNGGGPPVTNPGPNGWESLGCYTDSSSKTLVNYPKADQNASTMTVATCTSACQASGYTYAGVEYGGECYCGFWISNDGAPAADGCSITCNGNHSEFCGGSNRLNLYQLPNETYPGTGNLPDGWSALGCWTDDVQNRTLVTGEPVPGGYTNMTIENCLQVCQSNGFSLAGVEYSQECFCGNQVSNGGVCADPQTCNMPCRGNVNEICGGSDRLNMFQYGSGTVSACAGVATSTTSIASVASSTSSATSASIPLSSSTPVTTVPASTSDTPSSLSSSSTVATTTTTPLTSSSTPSSTSVPTSTTTAPASSSSSSFSTTTTPVSPSSSSFSTSTIPTTSTVSSSTSTLFTTSTTTIPSTTSTTSTTTAPVPNTTSTTSVSSTTSVPTSTSTPVTTFPTTSTTVAAVSTSSSTTVSACTPTTTSSTSFGNVLNGGFENGLLPWIAVTNQGSATVNVTNNALAFAGCQALFILPTSSPGTVRQVTVSQVLTPVLVPGRIYTLTMYQGRVNSASTASSPSIAIRFGSTTITVGPSCSGATCTVNGESGTVWQRINVPFVAPVLSTPVQFVFTWTDSNANQPILLDEISVKSA